MLLNSDRLRAARQIYNRMSGWKAIDELLTSVFQRYSQNNDRFLVLLKLRLINRLYHTNITAEDKVAQRIVRQNKPLSKLLAQGNVEAVQIISECGIKRKEQVFASKFAHFHQPERFAIGDKYVDEALKSLNLKPWNRSSRADTIATRYGEFYKQVEQLSRQLQISLKDADHYLWLKGQKEFAATKGVSKLNGEVRRSMKRYPNIWKRL